MARESEIQTKILKYLDSIGAYSVKTIATNKRGVPDILVCYKGKFIAIEVKTLGNKPSPLQIYNLDGIRESGGIAFVAFSVEDVKKEIENELFN